MSIIRALRPKTERRFGGPSPIPSNSSVWAPQGAYGADSDRAMRHAAVYACVRLVSDIVTSLPIDAYTGDVGMNLGEATRVNPKPQILTKPSAYLSGVQWRHQVMMSLLLQGNAYGLVTASDRLGYPTQIDLLDPQSVTVRKAKDNDINTATNRPIPPSTKVFQIGTSLLTSNEVWHCPGPMMPGDLAGLSPVKYAARLIGMGVEAEQFGLDFFLNGIHPTAVATTEQQVDAEQARIIKTRIKEATAARDVPVLGAGLKLSPWSVTPQDSMLLEVLRQNGVMVCQIFGVAPEEIGAAAPGSTITYANREQRAAALLTNAVNPWLVRLEDSYGGFFPRTTFVKHDTKGFLKSDLKSRYESWKTGIDAGFLLREEARQYEDLPEVDLPEMPVAPVAPAGPDQGPPA